MNRRVSTLQSAMNEWLEVFKFPALQRTSFDRIEATARSQVFPYIGSKQINDITPADLQKVLVATIFEAPFLEQS